MKEIILHIEDKQLELQLASLVEPYVDRIVLKFEDSESEIILKHEKMGIKPTASKKGKTKILIATTKDINE